VVKLPYDVGHRRRTVGQQPTVTDVRFQQTASQQSRDGPSPTAFRIDRASPERCARLIPPLGPAANHRRSAHRAMNPDRRWRVPATFQFAESAFLFAGCTLVTGLSAAAGPGREAGSSQEDHRKKELTDAPSSTYQHAQGVRRCRNSVGGFNRGHRSEPVQHSSAQTCQEEAKPPRQPGRKVQKSVLLLRSLLVSQLPTMSIASTEILTAEVSRAFAPQTKHQPV
jgi:hypothetical protein